MQIDINTGDILTVAGVYRPCFVAEATTQARDVIVTNLQDLLDAGWAVDSNPYVFCQLALIQDYRPDFIVVKSKYSGESWLEAIAQGFTDYLYITIESKSVVDIVQVSDSIIGQPKIMLYSGTEKLTNNANTIWVFGDADVNGWLWHSESVVEFESQPVLLESA